MLRRWWRRRTLAARITIIVTAVALAGFLLAARIIGGLIAGGLQDQLDAQLTASLSRVVSAVRTGEEVPEGTGVRVLNTSGEPVDGQGFVDLTAAEAQRLRAGEPITVERNYATTRWIGTTVSTPAGSQRLVVAGADLDEYQALLGQVQRWTAPLALLAAAAVAATAFYTVGMALRPVRRMRHAAQTLPVGQRLPTPPANDELRSLAEALNGLLTRRDEAAERMRRFSSAAAHELRSPVTSIRAQAEVAVTHPDADLAAETLAEVADESRRLSELLDELLASARSEAEPAADTEGVELTAAVRDVLARDEWNPQRVSPVLSVESFVPVPVLATPGEVAVVLDNLLRNAVCYARSQVRVMVLPAGRFGRLVVDDDGPGVTVEDRGRLFERLYRADGSRDRTSGGTGLGLSTVAELIQRRGGETSVGISPEGGTRLDVRWLARATAESLRPE